MQKINMILLLTVMIILVSCGISIKEAKASEEHGPIIVTIKDSKSNKDFVAAHEVIWADGTVYRCITVRDSIWCERQGR